MHFAGALKGRAIAPIRHDKDGFVARPRLNRPRRPGERISEQECASS
jgi:hypothetical protein